MPHTSWEILAAGIRQCGGCAICRISFVYFQIKCVAPALLCVMKEMRKDGAQLLLRLGVKSGGCSGLSYNLSAISEVCPCVSVLCTDSIFMLCCWSMNVICKAHLRFDKFYMQSEVGDSDHMEQFDFGAIAIDPQSFFYVFGTILDYSEQLMGGGFR